MWKSTQHAARSTQHAARSTQHAARSTPYYNTFLTVLLAISCLPMAQARGFHHHARHDDMTCITPDSTRVVRLPSASRREFHGIGSTVGTIEFHLELGHCGSLSGIDYTLIPSYRQTSEWSRTHVNGTLRPDSHSSARGVAVQILDKRAQPVIFEDSTLHPVEDDAVQTANARIPLQAQYIQTGETITPGTLHAAMTVLLVYE